MNQTENSLRPEGRSEKQNNNPVNFFSFARNELNESKYIQSCVSYSRALIKIYIILNI